RGHARHRQAAAPRSGSTSAERADDGGTRRRRRNAQTTAERADDGGTRRRRRNAQTTAERADDGGTRRRRRNAHSDWNSCPSANTPPRPGGNVSHAKREPERMEGRGRRADRKSTRLNSSHVKISYAVFCLKKKKVYKD